MSKSMRTQVAIIGAGSAGLSALRRVKQHTNDYVLIDPGPLGTKCARLGCMPSKALISVARDYHRRHVFAQEGIHGAERLAANVGAVMRHVRALRDHFAGAMADVTEQLAGDRLIRERATLLAPDRIRAGEMEITADRIILATGSRPRIPEAWRTFGGRILTSDTIFEQEDLPRRIAVVGLGPVGLELGQALGRLGLEVTAFSMKDSVGGLTDADVNEAALHVFSQEFAIHTGAAVELQDMGGALRVIHPEMEITVDAVLVAVGAVPDVQGLGLEHLGVPLDGRGLPAFDTHTAQIGDLGVFMAGDADACCPILHEALDEGFIAGHNGSTKGVERFCRRTRLYIVFSDPQIATVGQDRLQLETRAGGFVIGQADYSEQSRAMLELHNRGLVHIYVDRASLQLLGAELFCPDAEHLAHELALAIHNNMTVFDLLEMPFYHPTAEEGLRTALRDAAGQLADTAAPPELSLCGSAPEPPLS
ncbi:MAG: dihydrolipoyl dehydrogenase [Phycisphaerae bacterium]|nr:dihydrolipoyl dehydrogenase [Phycisphaerae bacterium]